MIVENKVEILVEIFVLRSLKSKKYFLQKNVCLYAAVEREILDHQIRYKHINWNKKNAQEGVFENQSPIRPKNFQKIGFYFL